jgi:hypothetical protein
MNLPHEKLETTLFAGIILTVALFILVRAFV